MSLWFMAWLASASGADIVAFGDSWAEQSGGILGDVVGSRYGLTVDNHGVGGSTAQGWNDTSPDALADAVAANPDARWVWLSILGNDTMGLHLARQGAQAAARNTAELTEMLDRLYAAHPHVRVAIFSYDWVNFVQSEECRLQAWLTFDSLTTPELVFLGLVNSAGINAYFERDVADVHAAVSAAYPQVWHTTLFGTLQADAGGLVSPALPSPASRMDDCIHPTDAGYRVLHRAWTDAYFGATPPVAGVTPPGPLTVCEGEDVVLTNASSADVVTWWAGDTLLGSGETIARTVSLGSDTLTLQADRGAWRDTVDVTVTGVTPPAVDAGDDLTTCRGGEVVLQGTADADVAWSPAASLDDPTSPTPIATVDADTTFTLTAGGSGCARADTVTVTVVDAPDVHLEGPTDARPGVPFDVRVVAPPGAAVTWTVGGVAVASTGDVLTVTPDTAGALQVEARVVADTTCVVRRVLTVVVSADDGAPDGAGDTGGDTADTAGEPWSRPPGGCCATAPAPAGGLLVGLVGLALGWRRRR